MGSASSIEYLQYLQQQQLQQGPSLGATGNGFGQRQPGEHMGGGGGAGEFRRHSMASGAFSGMGGGSGGGPGGGMQEASAAMLLREHLLNAGQLLWKSAPDMLQRMEVLEGQNRALSHEVVELRALLAKDDLFGVLEQVRDFRPADTGERETDTSSLV
jgi:hypothetical protein